MKDTATRRRQGLARSPSIKLCQGCKMSLHADGSQLCAGCESDTPRPLSSEFLVRLREELAQRDDTIVVRWLNGRGRIVHRGTTERAPGCNDRARRAAMCDTIAMYAFKHGWAAWGLEAAARELRSPDGSATRPAAYRSGRRQAEDDFGRMTDCCSCDNQKLESSAQTALLSSEMAVGKLQGGGRKMPLTSQQLEFAYERSAWTGATPQIMADALWLAGAGRRQIAKASGKVSREMIKGARGSAETVLLHYLLMNNHDKTLASGLELLLLGTYLAALDHGRVRDGDFTVFAGEVARHASLGRWLIAADELLTRWPGILDWHGGCLSTLGLVRGLELRGWAFAAHWDVVMHYELGSGADWEESLSRSIYVGAVLGHDAGDLCSDTRRGCADNSLLAVGGHSGWEGVAACLDVVSDALEAVVLRDSRGAIQVGLVAGSACATFERTGGRLCACAGETCEAMTVLMRVCGEARLSSGDATAIMGLQQRLRASQAGLMPWTTDVDDGFRDHADRERVYAEATMAMASGVGVSGAHLRLQEAYRASARAMCGELRRRAAVFRRRVLGGSVLDLSRGCLCGGECIDWR
ncbi:hypothetical protein CDD80_3751 [Ophiocordyceps camponoti-rufipedis]|uniref:Uncharacterized protein n=1 Tax=Ophiocordyceps camponoti-rufipedis TaxID=2004952 RepID=A0A2C5XIE1_9HYPO|nr:hypothetical protein CDD80_3751 [Ophiocordyceps camponoti-rufipedis]